tara:strand:- start:77 stop:247 length:171 start_codon:yes stop_codon:yes gene_type:complete
MMIENEQVKVGDEVRVGLRLMIVDEIVEVNEDEVIFYCIDEDGGDYELTENEIDIY